ncbi:hypothetical protein EB796_005948 [Bugula neritina]|uniref:Endonuclease/exonuclease/phosphatase domain-containing protein n=1 Tax=Bugula neritina TaxID=10212 RepID=A0A7J7KBZ0_BUGNE|nr:hypothetical protein EB796_005948 [Bugula neritina]
MRCYIDALICFCTFVCPINQLLYFHGILLRCSVVVLQSNKIMSVPSLDSRKMVFKKGFTDDGNDTTISLLQYNILADAAIPRGDSGTNVCGTYAFCPEMHRYMDSRFEKIIKEVESLNPDIVTLQEIEQVFFENTLQPGMNELGYASVQHLRPGDHIGLAIFYKNEKFSFLSHCQFLIHEKLPSVLQEAGLESSVALDIGEYVKRHSEYPGIIGPAGDLMVRLKVKATGTVIAVANVHVTWKEHKYPFLQIFQMSCVLEELFKFAEGALCILAGDFNATPDMPLYHMISSGKVCEVTDHLVQSNSYHRDRDVNFGGKRAVEILKMIDFKLKVKSSYFEVMGREPVYTNWGDMEMDAEGDEVHKLCLDYIAMKMVMKK